MASLSEISSIAPSIGSHWSVNDLPPYVGELDISAVKSAVSEARKVPYSGRLAKVDAQLKDYPLFVRFVAVVDSLRLDKNDARKILRVAKLAKSMLDLESKLLPVQINFFSGVESLLRLMDDMEQLIGMRERLIPRKVPNLTNEQREGKNLLDLLDSYRKEKIRAIEREEAELRLRLKELGRHKSQFGSILKESVPEYRKVLEARQTKLTNAERNGLMKRYAKIPSEKKTLTEEAYLAAARQNKMQKAELGLYSRFRRFGDDAGVKSTVDTCFNQAGDVTGSKTTLARNEDVDKDDLDELAPEM